MIHRGRPIYLATILAATLVGVACSSGSGATSTVDLLTYENALQPEVIQPFTQANPDLKVQATTFVSEDEAIQKLQTGSPTDVVYACLTDTQRLVDDQLIRPIDTSKLTAWSSLFPYYRDSSQIVVNGKTYMVPAFGGTTGLIYNPNKVPGGVSSFLQLMEDPALKGKVAIEDNPKYGIAMAALALGYKDPYDLTPHDLKKIKVWYLQHRSQIKSFYSSQSEFNDLYTKGQIVAAFGYKGYDVGLAKQNYPVSFAWASEGALTWTCGYSIGANAQNLDGAYTLLNWFLAPDAQAVYATKLNQIPTNQETLKVLPASVVDDVGLSDPSTLGSSIPTDIPVNYGDWETVWKQITSA